MPELGRGDAGPTGAPRAENAQDAAPASAVCGLPGNSPDSGPGDHGAAHEGSEARRARSPSASSGESDRWRRHDWRPSPGGRNEPRGSQGSDGSPVPDPTAPEEPGHLTRGYGGPSAAACAAARDDEERYGRAAAHGEGAAAAPESRAATDDLQEGETPPACSPAPCRRARRMGHCAPGTVPAQGPRTGANFVAATMCLWRHTQGNPDRSVRHSAAVGMLSGHPHVGAWIRQVRDADFTVGFARGTLTSRLEFRCVAGDSTRAPLKWRAAHGHSGPPVEPGRMS